MSRVAVATEPPSRLGLSRPRILAAALSLLDTVGLDAFTMRRLAAELGIGTMTLYGYFRTKDELLDAVVDHGAQQLFEIPLEPRSWDSRLRQLFMNLHRSHLEHPAIVELRFKRPLLSPGALRFTETGMEILTGAGFDNREAARAYRVFFVYTFGSSAFGPGRRPQADREQTVAALSGLPADLYPVLLGAAAEAADAMADETLFEFGLDLLLGGLKKLRHR
jgi:AcrR family transcriptional regulator